MPQTLNQLNALVFFKGALFRCFTVLVVALVAVFVWVTAHFGGLSVGEGWVAAGVFAGVAAGAGILFYLTLARPLHRISAALCALSSHENQAVSPRIGGTDLGWMDQVLQRIKAELEMARKAQVELAFGKALLFQPSSGTTVINPESEIQFIGSEAAAILSNAIPVGAPESTQSDADHLVGLKLTEIPAFSQDLPPLISKVKSNQASDVCISHCMRLGAHEIVLKIIPTFGPDGVFLGAVLGFEDVTKVSRDNAVLEGIDSNQLRIEFEEDHSIREANENFLKMIEGTAEDTRVCSLPRMFSGNLEGDTNGSIFAQKVMAGEISNGEFDVYSAHADRTFRMAGSFSLVKNNCGNTESLIFIGIDMTQTQKTLEQAEVERAAIAQEQSDVVALIGEALTDLASGNLAKDISGPLPESYEKLRNDFNNTVSALRDAILAVTKNADSIRNETTEITSAADDLSRRTEKQAATLEETAAALDELTVSVRSAAESADDASRTSDAAKKNAQDGGQIANRAVDAMGGIQNSSKEIAKITSVIDDIAFQTNLLALNAGVEAARAGEAGRGFAVVATEVRALAQRSSDAAREINSLISASSDQVNQGVDLVEKTGTALAKIVSSITDISERVSSIAVSAREQAAGLAEINTAVNELDHVTQQNAAMFEETTAASFALTNEADALTRAVSNFRLSDKVSSHSPTPSIQRHSPRVGHHPVRTPPMPITQGSSALALEPLLDGDGWEEF